MRNRKSVLVYVDKEQHKWMKDHFINFSAFVRDSIKKYQDTFEESLK